MLVYAVTKRMQASGGKPIVTDEEFLQIQRIATYGAETIEAVLTVGAIWTRGTSSDRITDQVIDQAHRWWTAIDELTRTPDVPAF